MPSCHQNILTMLAPEMLLHIMSFLPLAEVYRIRLVCKTWRDMAEEHIFHTIRSHHNTVDVRIGDKARSVVVKLEAHSYDPENCVVEFRPMSVSTVPMMVDANNPWSTCHRRMQIHFSEWKSARQSSPLVAAAAVPSTSISLQDQALILFHMAYNPALERMYELPAWDPTQSSRADHFVGDKGLILALSYVKPHHPSFYSYPSHTASVPATPPPHMQVQWLRVTLSWILSGIRSDISPTQIYPQRYAQLNHALARHGCFKYDPLSEPVLSHIVRCGKDRPQTSHSRPLHFPTGQHSMHADDGGDDVPTDLLEYVQVHTHECHTRLSRLQHMLEGAGVDARVLWKYTFAKSFVIGNGSLVSEEDVVRRIQDSENEWRLKRVSLTRRLGMVQ